MLFRGDDPPDPPMRHAVFGYITMPAAFQERLAPAITWAGWAVPVGLSVGLVAAMGLAMMGIAIVEFRKTE